MINILITLMFVLSVFLMHLAAFPAQAENLASYRVSAIKAHLFYHENGKFGAMDVINGKEVSLFNTIIGAGSAGMPSSITLVLVEVSGPNFQTIPGKLSVTATEGKRTLAKQNVTLSSLFTENGKSVHFPVLIYNTGCETVKITATIQGLPGGSKPNTMVKRIPFVCGE
ncbi:MAG: hypothetical protein PHG20_05115 [Geobacteraceae bacterium]|nr:hypothetical protein [Geobacteraceae bacterium]